MPSGEMMHAGRRSGIDSFANPGLDRRVMYFSRRLPLTVHSFLVIAFSLIFSTALPGEWSLPRVTLPAEREHPVIALPPGGVDLLRGELARGGPHAGELQAMIARGDRALNAELVFPPRGGHHGQWYQCDDCQRSLKTIDETTHQCPRCERIYSGEPYDDVVFSRIHSRNLNAMLDAAWAYTLTGDDRYAERAREVLLGYAERYRTYPYRQASRADTAYARKAGGRLFDQTLTEAMYLLRQIAPAYDLIHDSEGMSQEDHQKLREGLFDPMIESILQHRRGEGNWQSFHNAGLFWVGAVVGDIELMQQSISDRENGFAFQMDASVTDDGMWYEGSWSYHFYTLLALGLHAQGASHLGIDLWNDPRFKRMFTLPANYLMADGTLPRFGNATTIPLSRFGSRSTALMEAAYRAYDDPSLAGMLSAKPNIYSLLYGNEEVLARGEIPELPSVALPKTGHGILRSGGEAGLSAVLQFAPHGGFHSHFDKLSFVLFGHGQELGVDRGRAASQAYRLPIHRDWYRSTLSHNTVLVDLKNQKESSGELLQFLHTPSRAAAVARTTEAYPGVEHQRMLLVGEHYVVVFDQLSSDSDRRFDWFYHNRGRRAVSDEAGQEVELDGNVAGFGYLRDVRQGAMDGSARVKFEGENVTTWVLLAEGTSGTLTLADGPGRSVDERIPLMFATREGRTAEFAAVIEPVREGERPTLESITLEPTGTGHRITLDGSQGTEIIQVTDEHKIYVTPPAAKDGFRR